MKKAAVAQPSKGANLPFQFPSVTVDEPDGDAVPPHWQQQPAQNDPK